MKKGVVILSVLIITIIIAFSVYTYYLKITLSNIEQVNLKLMRENKLLNTYSCEGACFNGVRLAVTGNNKVKVGEKYKGAVVMGGYNSVGFQPFMLLSDSIDQNNQLAGAVDTVATNNWEGKISKTYNTKGVKKIFGKYLFKLNNDTSFKTLDFEIKIIVDD
jgi:hypothetical protein